MKALTPEQLEVLGDLPDAGPGALIKGSRLMSANALVRRNLARCLGIGANCGATFIRTPLGAKTHARESADVEAARIRRHLERLKRAAEQSPDVARVVRAVFGGVHQPGLGLDAAVERLRAGGFTSVMEASTAARILADQEVAP